MRIIELALVKPSVRKAATVSIPSLSSALQVGMAPLLAKGYRCARAAALLGTTVHRALSHRLPVLITRIRLVLHPAALAVRQVARLPCYVRLMPLAAHDNIRGQFS